MWGTLYFCSVCLAVLLSTAANKSDYCCLGFHKSMCETYWKTNSSLPVEQHDFNPAKIIYLISVLLLALEVFVLQTKIRTYIFRIIDIFHSCSLCIYFLILIWCKNYKLSSSGLTTVLFVLDPGFTARPNDPSPLTT